MSRTHLLIEHQVPGRVHAIFASFTRELFEALSPGFPPATLVRYDGNAVGDLVHIRLGVRPFTQEWVSEITAHECYQEECYFVDVGRKLPWPLTYWSHRHVVRQIDTNAVAIIEDITYGTNFALLTALVQPFVRQMFVARGPKYRAFFTQKVPRRDISVEPTS